MRKYGSCLIALLAAALLLAACSKDKNKQAAADSATPQAAVLNSVKLLKAGDFDGLWRHVLTPADYKSMRAHWGKDRDSSRITARDRQQFKQSMQRLTEPDAKQKLFADLKPSLDAYQSKYKTQLPMMIGMGQIMVGTQIEKSDSMTPVQKTQANDVLAAVAHWAQNTPWDDPGKARQAIGIVVDSARKLDLKTLDQAYALDYPAAMQRYSTAWIGLKQLLAVYGLSIDQILDSVKVKTLAGPGSAGAAKAGSASAARTASVGTGAASADTAKVEVDYSILGKPMSSTLTMVRKDGRWYDAQILKRWEQQRAKDQAARASSTAAGATAPAASTSAAVH